MTRTRGGAASRRLPPPRVTAAPAASRGSSFSYPPCCSCCAEPRRSATWPMIDAAGCGAKSSLSRGAIIPVQWRARWRRPGPGGPPCGGVARGAALISRVEGGGAGAGFAARLPPPSYRAEYASVTTGRTPGVTDHNLRWSEAWLGNRRHLPGVIRAVVAGPLPQAHCCGHGRGGHLARPRRGAGGCMVKQPLGCVSCCCGRWLRLWRWCVKVSIFFLDKTSR